MYPNTNCPHDCYRPGECDGSCTHPEMPLSEKPIQISDTPPAQHGASITTTNPTTHRDAFYNACAILMNIDCYELEEAGIIGANNGWRRFNDEPLVFLAKLDDDKREALWRIIQKRQPARYRV